MQSTLLRTLFHSLDKTIEYVAMRAIVNGTEDVVASYVQSVEQAEAFAEKHRMSRDVYFGVCTRSERKPKEEFVKRAWGVWADIDGKGSDKKKTIDTPKEEVLEEALESLILRPSIIVDSGHGYHLYWRSAPTEDLARVTKLNLKIQNVLQSGAVSDCTRILRVDGTYNHKSDPPAVVSIHTVNDVVYDLQDLAAMCRLQDNKIINKILTGDSRGYKSKSERDFAVMASLVKVGFTDSGVETIFQNFPIGDKYRAKPPEGGQKYFDRTLRQVRKKTKVSGEGSSTAADATSDEIAIFEKNDCYYMVTDTGQKQLSTFVFEPEILLHGEGTTEPDVILGSIKAAGYEWPNVAITRKAFVRSDTLIKELPLAAWQWIGPDSVVKHLLPYLMDKLRSKGLPKRTATSELGYYKGGYWIGSTQTLTADGQVLEDDAKVVALPTKGERPKVSYSSDAPSKESVQEFLNLFQLINTPEVVWPIFSWTAACPYKTRLQDAKVRFPSLNLYGTRGSGKTSIIMQVIQPFMGYDEPRTYDCSTTKFVMLSLLGSSNGVPVSFSEYRAAMKGSAERMLRYLLLSYDVGHDPKGQADQSVKDYVLMAPFTVDGNDALHDEAVMERIIQVNLHPETIDEDTEAFDAFQDLTMLNLKQIGTAYIQSTLKKEPKWDVALKLSKQAFPEKMPDRVRRNLSCCLVGLLSLEEFAVEHKCKMPTVDANFVKAVFAESLGNIVNAETGRGSIVTDTLVEDLINEYALTNGVTPYFMCKYDAETNVFWFQLSSALNWWLVKRRMQDRVSLDSAAVKAQLRERYSNGHGTDGGQYVVGREAKTINGNTFWTYGISLKAASVAGLDVPLSLETLRVRVVGKNHVGTEKDSTSTGASNGKATSK